MVVPQVAEQNTFILNSDSDSEEDEENISNSVELDDLNNDNECENDQSADEVVDISREISLELPNVDPVAVDVKSPLDMVQLDPSETSIFDNMFNSSNDTDDSKAEQEPSINLTTSPNGTKTVTQKIDEDCHMIYNPDQNVFKPADIGYQVKLNDSLSQNIPFKENVSLMSYFKIQF